MRPKYHLIYKSYFLLLALVACGSAFAKGSVETLQERMCAVFNERRPAVVKIFSVAPSMEENGRKVLSVGTAFFIDKKGQLLANANVVIGGERMWVEHEGRPYATTLLGVDPQTNLALLRAETMPKGAGYVDLSAASKSPPTASFLMAISCKLGFDPGPSTGMLVGRNSNYGNQLLPTNYLRTDIPSDGAEGGAPVFDIEGRFVGLVVISLPEIRASFLLPAAAVERVYEALTAIGHMDYAYLGLNARQRVDINGELQVCLDDVVAEGPAEAAGLEKGDVLLQMGGRTIRRDEDLREAVFFAKPDKSLSVKVLRDGKERSFSLKAAARETAVGLPNAQTAAVSAESLVP